jgi:hypothetical protein
MQVGIKNLTGKSEVRLSFSHQAVILKKRIGMQLLEKQDFSCLLILV